MQEWIVYLLKMTACSAILLLYYVGVLRNKSFNQYNRFFLLSSVGISLLLPLVHISVYWQGDPTQTPAYVETLKAITVYPFMQAGSGWISKLSGSLLLFSYLTVSGLLLFAILFSIRKIRKMSKQYARQRIGKVVLFQTNEQNTPFTFMNCIFWNRNICIDSQKGRQMLLHEWTHATQRHTYDLIFMKIVLAIAWINPFLYIFYKELVAVHEFLADEFAAKDSDKNKYAECLVTAAILQKNNILIAHHFNHSPFKRRIHMLLRTSTQPRFSTMRKAMIIPVIAGAFCTLAVHAEIQLTTSGKISDPDQSHSIELPGERLTDREAEFPGGAAAWVEYLIKTLRYPKAAEKEEVQGAVIIQFKVDAEGNVSQIEAISGPAKGGLKEEAIRVVEASGKWLPATKNGHAVESSKKQPIVFRLEVKKNK